MNESPTNMLISLTTNDIAKFNRRSLMASILSGIYFLPFSAQIQINCLSLCSGWPPKQPPGSPALPWHSAMCAAKKHKPDFENPCKATFLLMTLEESPKGASHVIHGAKQPPNLITLVLLQKPSHCQAAPFPYSPSPGAPSLHWPPVPPPAFLISPTLQSINFVIF